MTHSVKLNPKTEMLTPTDWQAEDLEKLITQNASANWSEM